MPTPEREKQQEHVRRLFQEGKTDREIAAALGIMPSTVKNIRSSLKLARPPSQEQRRLDRGRIERLYREGKTDFEIAKIVGSTSHFIRKIRQELKLTGTQVPVPARIREENRRRGETRTSRAQAREVVLPPKREMGHEPVVPQTELHSLNRQMSEIVDNEPLLRAVLRHACLVCPGLVRSTLEETDRRVTSVLRGGFFDYALQQSERKRNLPI